jgi:hypothetical protein
MTLKFNRDILAYKTITISRLNHLESANFFRNFASAKSESPEHE